MTDRWDRRMPLLRLGEVIHASEHSVFGSVGLEVQGA